MKKIIHAVNAQRISKTAQKEVKGAQAAAGYPYICIGDYACFLSLYECNLYCQSEYGRKCRNWGYACP
jgi:hypothetical protein